MLLFSFFVILISGCSNEINLYKTGESVPIVYCLLNPGNDLQYVRLGKSFLASGEIDIADIKADSLSWQYVPDVYLERWKNEDPVEVIIFEPADIHTRDTGLFPTGGLKLYTADLQPKPGEEYHLYVYFPDINKIISGETIIMDIPEVIDPVYVPGRTISFDTISPLNIRWTAGKQAGLYQGAFKMNYSETLNDDFAISTCLFSTGLYYKQTPDDIYQEAINGNNFFQAIGSLMKPQAGVSREILNFEFIFYSSGPELAILVGSDLGISNPFALIRNSSNITGGMGIFSSYTVQRVPNLQPSNTTKYFMATSQHTKHLGFKDE